MLAHPQSALLVYDALRLFRRVEIAGEASPVVDWSDLDLRRLKDLQRMDVVLYGPDAATHDAHCGIPGAFAAMQRGVERLRSQTELVPRHFSLAPAAQPRAPGADVVEAKHPEGVAGRCADGEFDVLEAAATEHP